jgi:hypothetical protein
MLVGGGFLQDLRQGDRAEALMIATSEESFSDSSADSTFQSSVLSAATCTPAVVLRTVMPGLTKSKALDAMLPP